MELETADTAKEFLDKIERELPAEISNQILDVIQAHKARQASGDQGEEVVREVVLKMEKLLVGAPVVFTEGFNRFLPSNHQIRPPHFSMALDFIHKIRARFSKGKVLDQVIESLQAFLNGRILLGATRDTVARAFEGHPDLLQEFEATILHLRIPPATSGAGSEGSTTAGTGQSNGGGEASTKSEGGKPSEKAGKQLGGEGGKPSGQSEGGTGGGKAGKRQRDVGVDAEGRAPGGSRRAKLVSIADLEKHLTQDSGEGREMGQRGRKQSAPKRARDNPDLEIRPRFRKEDLAFILPHQTTQRVQSNLRAMQQSGHSAGPPPSSFVPRVGSTRS